MIDVKNRYVYFPINVMNLKSIMSLLIGANCTCVIQDSLNGLKQKIDDSIRAEDISYINSFFKTSIILEIQLYFEDDASFITFVNLLNESKNIELLNKIDIERI